MVCRSFSRPSHEACSALLNKPVALPPAVLEGQEAWPCAYRPELSSQPPPTVTNRTSLIKSPPQGFLPFPLNGNYEAILIKPARNKIELDRTLTAVSPQASCFSSLSRQQVAAAMAIFLV